MNEKITTWGICCPGPSLNLARTWDQLHKDAPDYLVAVNCALNEMELFDYWVMLDIEVFEKYCEKFKPWTWRKQPILWVPKGWLVDIPRHHDPINRYFQNLRKETYVYNSSTSYIVSLSPELNWWNYSLCIAIAMAVSRGVKVINVYGADMCGEDYFIPGFRNGRTRHDDKRWDEETRIFNVIKYECKKQDICIVRR